MTLYFDAAVAVGRVRCVDLFDQGDNLFALGVAWGRSAVLPLVVPGPAHAHQSTYVPDGVVAGQQVHYFELFQWTGQDRSLSQT